MAKYIIQNINPLDTKPSVGVGIRVPFDGFTGINTTYTTQEAVKSNLLNWFLTNDRERPFNPAFGANLRAQLFEQINSGTFASINDVITQELAIYFPNVLIDDLQVQGSPDYNTIQIYFRYRLNETNIEDDIQITFTNG